MTYFFNGGVEKSNPGEDRVIIPSPKDVPTYDFKPEMSAPQVTETVVSKLKDYDLVIINFANPDMVGHTAHTTNLVHVVYVADDAADHQVKNGILADVALTVLDMLRVPKPPQMTGESLLVRK